MAVTQEKDKDPATVSGPTREQHPFYAVASGKANFAKCIQLLANTVLEFREATCSWQTALILWADNF